eukprot:3878494-Rhodomonas_salina.1
MIGALASHRTRLQLQVGPVTETHCSEPEGGMPMTQTPRPGQRPARGSLPTKRFVERVHSQIAICLCTHCYAVSGTDLAYGHGSLAPPSRLASRSELPITLPVLDYLTTSAALSTDAA